jgi:hypothetical protein
MILREAVQDCLVDLVIPEYGLVFFEAKAPQPTSHVHDGVLSARHPLRRAFNSHVDLVAERHKIDRLGQKPSAPFSNALRFVSASPWAVIMMTGTSGRRAFALGKSSSPLIPGILSDTPLASVIR